MKEDAAAFTGTAFLTDAAILTSAGAWTEAAMIWELLWPETGAPAAGSSGTIVDTHLQISNFREKIVKW